MTINVWKLIPSQTIQTSQSGVCDDSYEDVNNDISWSARRRAHRRNRFQKIGFMQPKKKDKSQYMYIVFIYLESKY